jgi:hypothetical protein
VSITGDQSLPVTRERDVVRQLLRVTALEAVDPGQVWRRPTDRPCRRGTAPVCHSRPWDCRACHPLDAGKACNTKGETDMIHRREVTARPDEAFTASGGSRARQPAPPVLGLGLEAVQCITNAMNAIVNKVILNSGRATRNAGWPYFDGTCRDYPAF